MRLQKIISIVAILIGLVGILFWILLLGSTDPYADLMINVAKVLVIVTAAIVLLFTLVNLVSHPSKLKKALLAIAGFLVVVVISYVLAKGEATDQVSASASKWVGTGLYAFYLLTLIAALTMLISGIGKFFKR